MSSCRKACSFKVFGLSCSVFLSKLEVCIIPHGWLQRKNFAASGPVELGERESLEKRRFRQPSLNGKDAAGCYYCKLDGHSPKQKRPRLKGMQRATCMAACRHFEACLTIFSLFVFLKTGRSKFLVDTVFLNSGKASQPPLFRQSMQEWQVLPKKSDILDGSLE